MAMAICGGGKSPILGLSRGTAVSGIILTKEQFTKMEFTAVNNWALYGTNTLNDPAVGTLLTSGTAGAQSVNIASYAYTYLNLTVNQNTWIYNLKIT